MSGYTTEAAARQTEYPVNGVCHRFQCTGIERQPAFKVKCAAAARSAMEHRLDRCPNGREGDNRIRIDEDQHLSSCFPCPSVPYRCDLTMPHSNNRGSMLLSDGRGPVRRCIVHNQNFRLLDEGTCTGIQRVQGATEQRLFIVGWNDERNHVT